MHRTPLSSWPLQGFSSRSTRTKALRRFTLQSCWWHQVWCSATESSGCLFTGILLWLNLRSVISNTCVYLLLHIQKLAYSYFIHTWQQRQISTIFYSLITKHLLETQRFTFGTLSPSLNIIYYLCKSSSNMSVWTKLHVCWAVQTCCFNLKLYLTCQIVLSCLVFLIRNVTEHQDYLATNVLTPKTQHCAVFLCMLLPSSQTCCQAF